MNIEHGLEQGQVVQRSGAQGSRITIKGVCSGSGRVLATCLSKKRVLKGWKARAVGRADKGTFAVKVQGLPAGGPYTLELRCGKECVRVRDFFVGDVWILAGQSNMQGYGNMAHAPGSHPWVRAFSMRRVWRKAEEPMHVLMESPDACHNGGLQCLPEQGELLRNTAKGVGPGLFFAREMLGKTGVPQGLICAAHGGTSMAQWSPQRKPGENSSLYGSLLDSVRQTGQPVAGVLWYQGESDANPEAASAYAQRMQELVGSLRRDLGQLRLPWIMVQIGRVFGDRGPLEDGAWNRIQEEQRKLPTLIPNLGVVAAIDLSLDDDIHVSAEGHARLGLRLSLEAGRLALGNRKEKPPPSLRSASSARMLKKEPDFLSPVVDVVFGGIEGGLRSVGEPFGFSLVDENGRDLRGIHKTTLLGNTVRLHLRSSYEGARLCYGLGSVPVCNIMDGRGHALPVFGPQQMGKPRALLPFVKKWKVTPPFLSSRSLASMPVPDVEALGGVVKEYKENVFKLDGFINEHEQWNGKSGRACFAARIGLSEAMRLEFLMGYDGPFRLWVDGRSFFSDLKGSNPCFPDESFRTATLPAGEHAIHVAMDLNHGSAWGFFLRFVRKDVTPVQLGSGDYVRPVYGV